MNIITMHTHAVLSAFHFMLTSVVKWWFTCGTLNEVHTKCTLLLGTFHLFTSCGDLS